MGRAIVEIQKRNGLRVNFDLPTISHILAIFQLQIISVAIATIRDSQVLQ